MRIWLAIGFLGALAVTTSAQDSGAPIAKPEIQSSRALTNSALNTNVVSKPKEPVIKYSGVAADFKRSTNRWKLFSLRAPRDPAHDGQNVIRDTRTEGGHPIKILSVDF